jgi:hypothetical protein
MAEGGRRRAYPKIGKVIAQLVMDATMSYDQIVTLIHQQDVEALLGEHC